MTMSCYYYVFHFAHSICCVLCRNRDAHCQASWFSLWKVDCLYMLPMPEDPDWQDMYLVRYIRSVNADPPVMRASAKIEPGIGERGLMLHNYKHNNIIGKKHIVQFLGTPHVRSGSMPKTSPLVYPAFLSSVDFRQGNPKIIFTEKHEQCTMYTGIVTHNDLMQGTQVFEDGTEPNHKEGRRLTQESWDRILELGEKYRKVLSFDLAR